MSRRSRASVGAMAAVVVVTLLAGVGYAIGDGSGSPEPGSPAPPRPAAVRDDTTGLTLGDFTGRPSYAEGVTPEMIEASERAGAEMPAELPPGGPAEIRIPASPEERLERAVAATLVERERFRERAERGFPAERTVIVPPDDATCAGYCRHLIRCLETADPADLRTCDDTCRRGGFGGRERADEVLRLRSCDHM